MFPSLNNQHRLKRFISPILQVDMEEWPIVTEFQAIAAEQGITMVSPVSDAFYQHPDFDIPHPYVDQPEREFDLLCGNHLAGNCLNQHCRFAHTAEDQVTMPFVWLIATYFCPFDQMIHYKSRECNFLIEKCPRGKNCWGKHMDEQYGGVCYRELVDGNCDGHQFGICPYFHTEGEDDDEEEEEE